MYGFVGNETIFTVDTDGRTLWGDPYPGEKVTTPVTLPTPGSCKQGEFVVTVPPRDPSDPDNLKGGRGYLEANRQSVTEGATDEGILYVIIQPTGDYKDQFNRRLKKVCGCIEVLQISGHGGGSMQRFGPGYYESRNQSLELKWRREDNAYIPYVENLDVFDGINFCKPCTIVLGGCKTASGEHWKVFYSMIQNKTGCRVLGFDVSPSIGYNGCLTGGPCPVEVESGR